MSDNHPNEPEVFPAEKIEIIPASQWQGVWRQPAPIKRKRRLRLPLMLFIATCLSTLLAGMQSDVDSQHLAQALIQALKYAVPLMTILVCHEMGHFLQARRYGVDCSFPYFIPMPFSPIGTMGAVIAMQARMGHRRALFDIGVTGPLAGLFPTLICCVVGIYISTVEPIQNHIHDMHIGSPLLFNLILQWLGKSIPAGNVLKLHPLAFAGWVGLLITSLNLIPISQLDGGHVLYAMLREKANVIARMLLFGAFLAVLFFGLYAWFLMIVLLIIIGPSHPPTADDEEPLGWWRYVIGWLTLAFIPFGFIPIPFNFGP
ncbi:MAG: site-2 protease family protein [Thermoguttaceae bacterium]